jgi:signal transduction histidine kinase
MIEAIRQFLAWVQDNLDYWNFGIYLLTATVSFILARWLWTLRKEVMSEIEWLTWFSWSFWTYGILYSVRAMVFVYHIGSTRIGGLIVGVFSALCIFVTHICFLVVAEVLSHRLRWREFLGPKDSRPDFSFIKKGVNTLSTKLLVVAIVAIAAFLLRVFREIFIFKDAIKYDFWRLLDAVVTCICLYLVSVAFSNSLKTGKARDRKSSKLVMALPLYGIVDIFWGLGPLLYPEKAKASYKLFDSVTAWLSFLPENASYRLLDFMFITILLSLKVFLFQTAWRNWKNTDEFLKLKDPSTDSKPQDRHGFPSGLLARVGEDIDADKVEMALCLPGQDKIGSNPIQVIRYKWSKTDDSVKFTNLTYLSISGKSDAKPDSGESDIEKEMRETIQEEKARIGFEDKTWQVEGQDEERAGKKRANRFCVPLKFRGDVIGCVFVDKKSELYTLDIRGIYSLVETEVVSLQAENLLRWASVEKFVNKFAEWRVEQEKIELQKASQALVDCYHDNVISQATRLRVAAGFDPFEVKNEKFGNETGGWKDIELAIDKQETLLTRNEREDGDQTKRLVLGELSFLPRPEDQYTTISKVNSLLGKLISSTITETLLDIHRDHFNRIIKEFSVAVGQKDVNSRSSWFEAIKSFGELAGACWVYDKCPKDNNLLESVESNEETEDNELSWMRSWSGKLPNGTAIHIVPFKPPRDNAHQAIHLSLPETNADIWLGIENANFGPELNGPTPWYTFLDRFSVIANTALIRLNAMAEKSRLMEEYLNVLDEARTLATIGSVVHDIANKIQEIALKVDGVNSILTREKLLSDAAISDRIRGLRNSVNDLVKSAKTSMKLPRQTQPSFCRLSDAAQLKPLLMDSLQQNGIDLEVEIPSNLVIEIPALFVTLAIDNLVHNAKDAIGVRGGKISIVGYQKDDMIVCEVTDTGPGISEEIRTRLFNFNETSKESGHGWGLYLTRQSLRQHRAEIELIDSQPGQTRFRIRFPMQKTEN